MQLPIFNERYVTERLVEAVSRFDYPPELLDIQVLDDSTDETRQIAQTCVERHAAQGIPINHIHRSNREGFKAGALENGLKTALGEFIAIFDADHVPLPTFLDHTLGYFVDEKVAFVQTPQEFYNLDSAQHRTNWQKSESWHEQSMFYRIIQPGKNRWNLVFWCGSGSVMRRAALIAVGLAHGRSRAGFRQAGSRLLNGVTQPSDPRSA